MWLPLVIVSTALLESACGPSDPIKAAEAKAEFLEQHHGTLGELCEVRRQIQAMYADRRDGNHYELARIFAKSTCYLAETEGANMPANSDERERLQKQAAEETDAMMNVAQEVRDKQAAAKRAAELNQQYEAAEAELKADLKRDMPAAKAAINEYLANEALNKASNGADNVDD